MKLLDESTENLELWLLFLFIIWLASFSAFSNLSSLLLSLYTIIVLWSFCMSILLKVVEFLVLASVIVEYLQVLRTVSSHWVTDYLSCLLFLQLAYCHVPICDVVMSSWTHLCFELVFYKILKQLFFFCRIVLLTFLHCVHCMLSLVIISVLTISSYIYFLALEVTTYLLT